LEKIVGVGIGIGIDSTGDIGLPISTAIPIYVTVKLLLPPRQSRGISPVIRSEGEYQSAYCPLLPAHCFPLDISKQMF
ncbi:MAG: hypothetical protein JXR49_11650, partial [Acidobacteria bacterium]|nr:hypothetical protein [Acidobacteriota bacterium]